MKIVIRNSVFETNSSSTHSFTIVTSEKLKEMQEQQLQYQKEIDELRKKKLEDLSEDEELKIFRHSIGSRREGEAISFQIKSPLAKLNWIKGLIDNAKNKKDKILTSIYEFYDALKKEYCAMENITEETADSRILSESYKCNYRCRGGKCDQYFREGALEECCCGFQNFNSIWNKLSLASGGISLKYFAKEFITEKYIVIGKETLNFGVIKSDVVY